METKSIPTETIQCPRCKGDTIAPDPQRPEEQGHYCETCGIAWDADRVGK